MMFGCFIRADRLRLAAGFQSKDPTRYYLNGVFIEPLWDGVRLCATDGTMMGIFRDEAGDVARPMTVHVPKSALRAIKSVRKHEEFVWFGIIGAADRPGRHEARVFDAENSGLSSLADIREAMKDACHDCVIWSGAVTLIDGEFPAFERMVPARRLDLAEGAGFSAFKLVPFQEVARTIGSAEGIRFYPAGLHEAIAVDCGRGDFVGILMPYQFGTSESFGGKPPHAQIADWARDATRTPTRRFEDEAPAQTT
jgi:hypothetical protein